jgi:hypothetical protein
VGRAAISAFSHSNLLGLLRGTHIPVRFGILKVPKREIFDRSDFPDFYTIKSLRLGDFGVKIKNLFKHI